MALPTLVFSEVNGSGAGTPTDNIAAVNFASQDLQSGTSALLINYPVPTGLNSMEKYNCMKVVTPSANTLSAFTIYFASTQPVDGAGVASTLHMKFGITPTYAQPVATTSTVATTLCSTNTTTPGVSFAAPANTAGAYSGYFVQQMQVDAGAIGGNAVFPATWLVCSFVYS